MAQYDVIGATPKTIELLKKAEIYLNKQKEDQQDEHANDQEYSQNNISTIYVPVRVVSGNGIAGYICDIYENGLNSLPTKQGKVFLANGASTIYALPAGTVMYAQKVYVQQIGTNE